MIVIINYMRQIPVARKTWPGAGSQKPETSSKIPDKRRR
jgi:hypothetical protein